MPVTPVKNPSLEHPEAQAKVHVVEETQPVLNFVTGIRAEVEHAGTDRQAWEENATRWFKKRYGIRPSAKNFPFPNASNTHIHLVEETIRRLKPNYINLAFEGDPVVTMFPVGSTPLEVAQHAELYMDWLLRFHMDRVPGLNYIQSLAIIVDLFLEKGFSFSKQIYEHQVRSYTEMIDLEELPADVLEFITNKATTDEDIAVLLAELTDLVLEDPAHRRRIDAAIRAFRKGETRIPLRVDGTVYRGPRVMPVAPEDLFVPPDTTDIETARFLCHRLYLTLNELRMGEKVGKYKDVDAVAANPSAQKSTQYATTLTTTKATREGVTEYLSSANLLEVWEIFCWYDLDGDGVEEKIVVTYHPNSETILRIIEFPYRHGQWPFVRWSYELSDVRWYAPRGVPAFLDHYQTLVTNQENAKQDYMTLANSLQYKYRSGSLNPNQIRWIPGQGIPVQRMEDLETFQMPRLDLSFDQEMDKLRALSKELIGQPDFALTQLQQNQERRTAFEVSEAVSLAKQIFSLDARLFKASLQRLYSQLFALELQYGPEDVWVQVTGGERLSLTKEQITGDLVIVPNGEFTLLSRTLEQQRAFAILELAVKDQSGALNTYEAWRNYLLKVDPKASQRIMAKPDEYAQIQRLKIEAQQAEIQQKLALAGRVPANGAAAPTGASRPPAGKPATAMMEDLAR